MGTPPPPFSLSSRYSWVCVAMAQGGGGTPKSCIKIVYLYVEIYKKKSEILLFHYSFSAPSKKKCKSC